MDLAEVEQRVTVLKNVVGLYTKNIPEFVMKNIATLPQESFKDMMTRLRCCKTLPKVIILINAFFWKSMTWLPSIAELVIFGTFVAIVFIIAEIAHNNYINNRVKKESRCVRLKQGPHNQVTAVDSNGNPMYTIMYDANNNPTKVCESDGKGSHVNEYNNVKVYDPKTGQSTTASDTLTCNKQTFDQQDGQIYYSGDEQLIKFMESDDLRYFNSAR